MSRNDPILGNVIVIGVDDYGGIKDLEERPASTCISIESVCQVPAAEIQKEMPASPSVGSRATNVNSEMALSGKVSLKDRPFKIDITPEPATAEIEDSERETAAPMSPQGIGDDKRPSSRISSANQPHRPQVEHDKQLQSEFDVILFPIGEEFMINL